MLLQPDLAATDLADRFAGPLEFGTAGLRGVVGAGPNRMNRAVVARATWGLAQVLLADVPRAAERKVVVGGDARRMSRELSEDVAAIFAAAGLRVVFFREPVPTPLVGFTVKRLGAAAGVVITASHNPPEYNGYKVYWENAAQIVPPIDARIAAAIALSPPARAIERPPLEDLALLGLVTGAPADADRPYLDAVRGLAVHPTDGDRGLSHRLHAAPRRGGRARAQGARRGGLHARLERRRAAASGRRLPDGRLSEPRGAGRDGSRAVAREGHARGPRSRERPDVDRLAVALAHGDAGEYRQLTGNEVGVLLGHYLLTERPVTRPRAVIASIVSSPLLGRIAADLGVHYEETLTGFKWIANRAIALGREGYEFVFGYEEALGYCVGDVVHDKDGISAAVLVAELAAVLRARGKTLMSELDAIARRWGVFTSTQVNVTRSGAAGVAAIRAMMDALRGSPPTNLGGDEVVALADYQAGRPHRPPLGDRTAADAPEEQRGHARARIGQSGHRASERDRAQGQVLLRRSRRGPRGPRWGPRRGGERGRRRGQPGAERGKTARPRPHEAPGRRLRARLRTSGLTRGAIAIILRSPHRPSGSPWSGSVPCRR